MIATGMKDVIVGRHFEVMKDGRRIHVLAQGRLVNLATLDAGLDALTPEQTADLNDYSSGT